MIGIIKKFDPQGFGIIKASDGSKLAFILSDSACHQSPQEGQKVIFSIRSVKGSIFRQPCLYAAGSSQGSLVNNC